MVQRALMRLPVEQRAAVVAVDMQGYSIADTARLLGVPEGTVKSRCARARARLAQLLGYLNTGAAPRPIRLPLRPDPRSRPRRPAHSHQSCMTDTGADGCSRERCEDRPDQAADPPLTVELLADLQAGLLDDDTAARVRRQVRADPEAEATLRALNQVRRDVAAVGADPTSAPDAPPDVIARSPRR